MKKGEKDIIKIEKNVYPGKALGRGEDGIATFTHGVLAGETAEVEIRKSKKTFKEAVLLNVIESSPKRIVPLCPSFGNCGGCSMQFASYNDQLDIKKNYLKDLLGFLEIEIQPVLPSPEEYGYRNKMEFSFFDDNGTLSAGLHKKGEFSRYFPVPPCLIADKDMIPLAEAVVTFARSTGFSVYDKRTHTGVFRHLVLRKAKRTGQMLVNIVTSADEKITLEIFKPLIELLSSKITSLYWTINGSISDAVIADKLILLSGQEIIEEKLSIKGADYSFSISPFSFFQTNTLGTEKLYEIIIDLFDCRKSDRVLDLYCGTGTIGMVISPYVRDVLGVEQIAAAVENAEYNSKQNSISNISFMTGSVEKWIKSGARPEYNSLIIDPPRGGTSNKVINFISETKPEKIVYVSCNPSTLARDLKDIIEKGGYKVERIAAIDMFPQTYHIETVVSLRKIAD